MGNVTDGQTVRTEDIVVREGDGGFIVIDIPTDPPTTIHLDEQAADRICTALGQLLTDRHVRKHGTPDQLSEAIADQVERAELLADAQPASAADMSEGELILGRRVPSGRLCPHCSCYHEGECDGDDDNAGPQMVVHVARWRERGKVHMHIFKLPIGSDYVAEFWRWHSKLGFNDMVSDLSWE